MSASILASIIGLIVVGGLAGLSIYFSYKKAKKRGTPFQEWLEDWLGDFSTEMAGAFLTAILFGLIVLFAGKTDAEAELKAELIQQLSSQVVGVPQRAVEQLRLNGWLTDGSLNGITIETSDLSGGMFYDANLQRVLFLGVDLRNANFINANLQGAVFVYSNLMDADLRDANLNLVIDCSSNLEQILLDSQEGSERHYLVQLPSNDFWITNFDISHHPNETLMCISAD